MKKFIWLLSFCLILTGCSVEYQLYVGKGDTKEVLTITIPNATKKDLEDILAIYEDPTSSATGDYTFALSPTKNSILATNKNKIIKDNSSTLFRNCYDSVDLIASKNKFSIQTKGKFKCYNTYQNLEKVTIRINIDGVVTYHNADRVNGKNYYWDINSKNLGRSLILEAKNIQENKENVQEQQPPEEKPNEKEEQNIIKEQLIPIFLVIVVLLVIVLSGMIYLAIKNKKNNKI